MKTVRPSRRKKPTIRVVAAKAGVAVSTVSRYLNDDSVSPRMKARLSRVIESLDYKPSRTARNLSLGLKGCIGVVVDSIQDPWFTQLLTGMEEELQSRDTSLMLLSLELRDTYDPAIAFEWIDERRVDGLIIAKCHRRDKSLVRAALGRAVPIVAIAPDEALHRCQLSCGPTTLPRGGRSGAYLAELGHMRVAFTGGPQRLDRVSPSTSGAARGTHDSAAFRSARRTSAFVPAMRPGKGPHSRRRSCGSRRVQRLSCSAATLWPSGFIRAVQRQGVQVPDDLSVAGVRRHSGRRAGRGRA